MTFDVLTDEEIEGVRLTFAQWAPNGETIGRLLATVDARDSDLSSKQEELEMCQRALLKIRKALGLDLHSHDDLLEVIEQRMRAAPVARPCSHGNRVQMGEGREWCYLCGAAFYAGEWTTPLASELCAVVERMRTKVTRPCETYRGYCHWCFASPKVGEALHREGCAFADLDALLRTTAKSEVKANSVLSKVRLALRQWVEKQGHDRCWYYPEIFRELCQMLDVGPVATPSLPTRPEFEEGCRRYQQEEFGEDRGSSANKA